MKTFYERVDIFKKSILTHALERAGGSVPVAAKELGIRRTEVYTLLKRYGLTHFLRPYKANRGNWGNLSDRGSVRMRGLQ